MVMALILLPGSEPTPGIEASHDHPVPLRPTRVVVRSAAEIELWYRLPDGVEFCVDAPAADTPDSYCLVSALRQAFKH